MNIAAIKWVDIANGVGCRVSIFVSGCRHHCPGCFNEEAWDFNFGEAYTPQLEQQILQGLAPSYIHGLSLLGGEPFEVENQRELVNLLKKAKELYPQKNIWCYSGFTYEELTGERPSRARCDVTDEMLSYIDVLVEGRFVEELKDISLRFRGSSNQRILDLPQSLAAKTPIWWKEQ